MFIIPIGEAPQYGINIPGSTGSNTRSGNLDCFIPSVKKFEITPFFYTATSSKEALEYSNATGYKLSLITFHLRRILDHIEYAMLK